MNTELINSYFYLTKSPFVIKAGSRTAWLSPKHGNKKSRIKHFYSGDRLRGQTLRRQIRKKLAYNFFGQPRFRRISLPTNLSKQYFKNAGNRNISKGEGDHKDLQK